MNSIWDSYPETYRVQEVAALLQAVRAGECVSLVGLSGAGKSNLMGFIAHRVAGAGLPEFLLLDCNRLARPAVWAFLDLFAGLLEPAEADAPAATLAGLQTTLARRLAGAPAGVCLLVDRLDSLPAEEIDALADNLRALRDAFKYRLTYVIGTRRPLPAHTELAELFYANTLWLGPLTRPDALWSAAGYAARRGQVWSAAVLDALLETSRGYPSFLRAACEAYAAGAPPEPAALLAHPAVQRRLDEFWRDRPSADDLHHSGLDGHPWLRRETAPAAAAESPADLTAAEFRLLEFFKSHAGGVCSKDELIAAVWPEEVHAAGLRDDSLAQLVRRLRLKIEPDPANPRRILTVAGRGYRYLPG